MDTEKGSLLLVLGIRVVYLQITGTIKNAVESLMKIGEPRKSDKASDSETIQFGNWSCGVFVS